MPCSSFPMLQDILFLNKVLTIHENQTLKLNLAEVHADVYKRQALDAVEEMLFIAQEKTRKKAQQVEYVCGDMERFVLNRPARAAVCACDGVNYLPDKDALRRFFRCVHTNLQENGLFLFDISSAYKLENIIGNEFFYDDGEEETVFWKNHFDEQNLSLIHIYSYVIVFQLIVYLRMGDYRSKACVTALIALVTSVLCRQKEILVCEFVMI